jgi:hypothetical protein
VYESLERTHSTSDSSATTVATTFTSLAPNDGTMPANAGTISHSLPWPLQPGAFIVNCGPKAYMLHVHTQNLLSSKTRIYGPRGAKNHRRVLWVTALDSCAMRGQNHGPDSSIALFPSRQRSSFIVALCPSQKASTSQPNDPSQNPMVYSGDLPEAAFL